MSAACTQTAHPASLSPWPVRLLAWGLLVLVALGAILLIDRHVMARMPARPHSLPAGVP